MVVDPVDLAGRIVAQQGRPRNERGNRKRVDPDRDHVGIDLCCTGSVFGLPDEFCRSDKHIRVIT